MHDIDRAMFESEQETYEGAGESQESFETESYESLESSQEADGREMEMAAELLEVSSEEELEAFLGNLVSSRRLGRPRLRELGHGSRARRGA